MKRKILSILLCISMSVAILAGCGTRDVDATDDEVTSNDSVEEEDDKSPDTTKKEDDIVNVTKNLEEQYIESIEAYQEYYEKAKSDFSGKEVGATIFLDKNSLPLMWLGISEDGTKDNFRTQLIGYVDGEATIKAERNEYVVPCPTSEIVLGLGGGSGEKKNVYVWDDDKQDFRNVNSELEDIENSETVYSEEELEEKIEFLYPIYKGINFANSVQIVLNNSTSQVAYLGYDDNSVFETLRCLNVIHAISAEGDCYGYFLKTDYKDNSIALSYYEKLADNKRLSADEEDAWWKKKYSSDMASDVIKDSRSVFTSSEGTILDSDVYEKYLSVLNNDGWEKTGLSHPYANDVEVGQLLRGLASKPIYSQEELYLYMVSILNNCEITKININDIQVQADEAANNSKENHDYLIYIEDIDDVKAYKDDNSIKIYTKREVVDRYTGEDETDRIKFPVSAECKFIKYGEESYGENIKDFCNMIEETMENFVGDEQPLNVRVVVEGGEIVLLGIGYGDNLTR